MILEILQALVTLFSNKNFVNILLILIVICFFLSISIYFIYEKNEEDKFINDFIELKFQKQCDIIIIYKTKGLFSGRIVYYFNHDLLVNLKEDVTITEIIKIIKNFNYNFYILVYINNKILIIGWINEPNKKTMANIHYIISQINSSRLLNTLIQNYAKSNS